MAFKLVIRLQGCIPSLCPSLLLAFCLEPSPQACFSPLIHPLSNAVPSARLCHVWPFFITFLPPCFIIPQICHRLLLLRSLRMFSSFRLSVSYISFQSHILTYQAPPTSLPLPGVGADVQLLDVCSLNPQPPLGARCRGVLERCVKHQWGQRVKSNLSSYIQI